MRRRIILSPDAEADISAIERWYQSKETSLAFAFKVELRVTLHFIAQYPYAFPEVRRGVRRALMKQFPYLLYFRLRNGVVSVLAVLHERRRQTFDV
jgi:plasmid stabilization system protein ParE